LLQLHSNYHTYFQSHNNTRIRNIVLRISG